MRAAPWSADRSSAAASEPAKRWGEPRPRREYLYTEQLAEVTPWTPPAIRTMVARGEFKEGVHYFRPHGPGSRPIFKLSAVVDYIEGSEAQSESGDTIRLAGGTVIDIDQATKEATRLLR